MAMTVTQTWKLCTETMHTIETFVIWPYNMLSQVFPYECLTRFVLLIPFPSVGRLFTVKNIAVYRQTRYFWTIHIIYNQLLAGGLPI